MANLLVMYDNSNANPSYLKFDVVEVRGDDVPFGSGEGYPVFLKVHLVGVSERDAKFLQDIEWDETIAEAERDKDTGWSFKPLHRRAWKIAESRLNPPIIAALDAAYQASEIFEVSDASGMLNWLERKLDGSQPPAWGHTTRPDR